MNPNIRKERTMNAEAKGGFKVCFDVNGEVAAVEQPKGKRLICEKVKLKKNPIDQVDDIKCVLVIGKRGKSPCCIVFGGWEWCWC